MEFDKALEVISGAFYQKHERSLTAVEIALVYGAWNNLTYDRIAERSGYTVNYLQRDVGPKFWKLLSTALDRKVNKTTLRAILTNQKNPLPHRIPEARRVVDWGEAPDVSYFQGRQEEIDQLTQCITEQRCRLVAIVGQGGIGKSSLAAKVARQVEGEFDVVVWRSLRNTPPLEALMAELVPFVSGQKDIQARPERLLHWLQTRRCLIILDNQETLLQPGKEGGYYQPQFANYADLMQMLGETSHQSCVVLTSRERSHRVGLLEDSQGFVRLFVLKGSWEASLSLVEAKRLVGSDNEKRRLCELYRCNPLALKMAATSIKNLFEGEIATFFATETPIFNGIRRLLDQQFERLSPLEQTLMYWLAINREWTALATLQSDLVPAVPSASLLEALESLTGRGLIEKRVLKSKAKATGEYTQQPVVMEYITDRLIQQLVEELVQGKIVCLNRYALTKTTVLDYIRESQVRVILTPLIKGLQDACHQDTERLKQHLQRILFTLRSTSPLAEGYGAGNLLNLCLHLGIDLTGYDFSHLTIRHAALQGGTLQQVKFQAAQFVETTFTQTFAGGVWVGFSPDGQHFAVGDANASLHIWQFEPMQLLRTIKGDHNWVMAAAWHPDGKTLACSIDQVIKLFNAKTGQWIKDFEGEIPWAIALAWSPGGKRLACAGKDVAYITVWDGESGDQLIQLEESAQGDPTQWLMGLTWLADGALIAGAYLDHTIKIWDVATGDCIQVIPAHENWVASLALHPDGRILASSGFDNTVKLWDWQTGECLATTTTLDYIWQLEWQEDGDRLAGASPNYTISIWDCSLQCLHLLQGHQSWVWAISWQRSSNLLISVAHDQVIKLWNTQRGDCIKTVKGYSNSSWCMRWNKDGTQLLSSSTNHTVQLWDGQTGTCIKVFRGHQNEVLSVAWSPDENWIASSGTDAQIRIWNVKTGQCVHVLCGHAHWIRSIVWHPDGQYLISGSYDQTIKLWDAYSGECLLTLSDSQNQINAVAWLPNGNRVASASIDGNIRFWDLDKGICDRIIPVGSSVHPVALSPDGKTLASGDYNNTLILWDVKSGVRLQTFQVQTPGIMFSLGWSSTGHKIATSSSDLTVRIWNVRTGECEQVIQGTNHGMAVDWHPHVDLLALAFLEQPIQLWDRQTQSIVKTLRCDRPYEGMNIADVTGITEAQKATLKALGASSSN